MVLCPQFQALGKCSLGGSCTFDHVIDVSQANSDIASNACVAYGSAFMGPSSNNGIPFNQKNCLDVVPFGTDSNANRALVPQNQNQIPVSNSLAFQSHQPPTETDSPFFRNRHVGTTNNDPFRSNTNYGNAFANRNSGPSSSGVGTFGGASVFSPHMSHQNQSRSIGHRNQYSGHVTIKERTSTKTVERNGMITRKEVHTTTTKYLVQSTDTTSMGDPFASSSIPCVTPPNMMGSNQEWENYVPNGNDASIMSYCSFLQSRDYDTLELRAGTYALGGYGIQAIKQEALALRYAPVKPGYSNSYPYNHMFG